MCNLSVIGLGIEGFFRFLLKIKFFVDFLVLSKGSK
ncbi:hypothetical protein BCO_0900012 [Borrelia coriaceae ATCC 43381]|uniref:Uncharacterized protein n=1 Tax=Borrelia coriaceae ATCC 43381 TaxID=1408429 RepID=W5SUE8_9SPIR|nr:hypothetical protein BCO_0900012 [Borrelia coriaceae ATCC 43381]